MILIGTSGFSFPDWKGPFYPPGIGQKDLLAYYCRFFPAVELNYSYYTMPTASQTLKLSRQVPENFTFTIKAHRSMTHQPQDLKQACTDFKKGIEPLLESGKLGCILWQFPWSFQYSAASLAHIRQLSSLLEGLPNVVEFRHRSWLRPEVEGVLRENQLGYCTVDEPDLPGLMPPVAKVTGKIAYVRFHGRNREKWWQSRNSSERYDYLYSTEELAAWLPKIQQLKSTSEKTFIFFNNCHMGQAARNAIQLQKMLGQVPPDPPPRQGSLF